MRRFLQLLEQNPIKSFIILVCALGAIIILANSLRAPETLLEKTALEPRSVNVFVVGTDTPTTTLPAEVRKSGVITVIALTSGVIQRIHAVPGQKVTAYQALVTLTNDNGTGAAALRAAIARENQRLTEKNYATEKSAALLQEKVSKDQSESDAAKNLAEKNLILAKRGLASGMVLSDLGARAAESEWQMLRPTSPVTGTLEHLAVRVGEYVTPGTVIATVIAAGEQPTLLEGALPQSLAVLVNPEGEHSVSLFDTTLTITPRYFAAHENSAGMYTFDFRIPSEKSSLFAESTYVPISVSLLKQKGDGVLIPIDALFQSHGKNSVHFLDQDNLVKSQEVDIEEVIGGYALVHHLESGIKIVTDRLVVEGEVVVSNHAP